MGEEHDRVREILERMIADSRQRLKLLEDGKFTTRLNGEDTTDAEKDREMIGIAEMEEALARHEGRKVLVATEERRRKRGEEPPPGKK